MCTQQNKAMQTKKMIAVMKDRNIKLNLDNSNEIKFQKLNISLVLCTQQNENNSDNDDCSNIGLGHNNKIPLEDIKPITGILE